MKCTVVVDGQWLPLPNDLDEAMAAVIANPGMSSWAALTERANLNAGGTVLINGATGAAGRLAVKIARYLGAGRIIEQIPGPSRHPFRDHAASDSDLIPPCWCEDRVLLRR